MSKITWAKAVSEWNKGQIFRDDLYGIPKKGGEYYDDVKAIMAGSKFEKQVQTMLGKPQPKAELLSIPSVEMNTPVATPAPTPSSPAPTPAPVSTSKIEDFRKKHNLQYGTRFEYKNPVTFAKAMELYREFFKSPPPPGTFNQTYKSDHPFFIHLTKKSMNFYDKELIDAFNKLPKEERKKGEKTEKVKTTKPAKVETQEPTKTEMKEDEKHPGSRLPISWHKEIADLVKNYRENANFSFNDYEIGSPEQDKYAEERDKWITLFNKTKAGKILKNLNSYPRRISDQRYAFTSSVKRREAIKFQLRSKNLDPEVRAREKKELEKNERFVETERSILDKLLEEQAMLVKQLGNYKTVKQLEQIQTSIQDLNPNLPKQELFEE